MPATKKRTGRPAWTEEQKQTQRKRLQEMNEIYNQIEAERKTKPTGKVQRMTIGKLAEIVNQLRDSGVSDSAVIEFKPSCFENTEISCEKRFVANKAVDVVTVR